MRPKIHPDPADPIQNPPPRPMVHPSHARLITKFILAIGHSPQPPEELDRMLADFGFDPDCSITIVEYLVSIGVLEYRPDELIGLSNSPEEATEIFRAKTNDDS